uniref:CNNM transmembrane domain-containing protein n=1 Tax=Heterorhabditis bacteriophora TaxID=37862 RepID=A0A1I7XK78_HETBA
MDYTSIVLDGLKSSLPSYNVDLIRTLFYAVALCLIADIVALTIAVRLIPDSGYQPFLVVILEVMLMSGPTVTVITLVPKKLAWNEIFMWFMRRPNINMRSSKPADISTRIAKETEHYFNQLTTSWK